VACLALAKGPARKNPSGRGCLACVMGQGARMACARAFRSLLALRQGIQGPSWPAVRGAKSSTEGGRISRPMEQRNLPRGARKLFGEKT